jgi:hypothetical protein
MRMSVYVFLGPTLSRAEARAALDAVYLPPVAQGDVYRLARAHPRAIGIVDGYFERIPAVWHKEIMWAMSEGVHVFGSASMGALRAAELAPFGMEGVGAIYEAYRAGALKDDDEVAVTHGSAEAGYAAQSEAMVNIRATLAAAEASGVIAAATGAALAQIAKALFYPDRVYPRILRLAADQGLPAAELAALAAWLPAGRVDQKRADALAMLAHMRARLADGLGPKQVDFHLEPTANWERAQRSAQWTEAPTEADAAPLDAVLDELGLRSETFGRTYQAALLSYLALEEARRRGYVAEAADVERMRTHFCQTRGLPDPAALSRWLDENHLTPDDFERLMREETLRARLSETVQATVVRQLPDHLRLVDGYARLAARAAQKEQALAARGLGEARLEDVGLTEPALLEWSFARQHEAVPADLAAYARAHGFGSEAALLRALLREYCFVRGRIPLGMPPARVADLARALLANAARGGQASPGTAPSEPHGLPT